jgi:UDPglucose 6-dehydrogenase
MAPKSAQVMKYAANAFLASRLSMAHELARFCDELGVDASEVLNSLGDDPRIGHNYLELAPGWGGQCFPKDTAALVALGDERGFDFHMTRAAIRSNEEQIAFAVAQIRNLVTAEAPRVALLGLTFKPKTSDRRASSALRIAAS